MQLGDAWAWLENLPLAQRIGESWWFPLLESLHVLGVVWVVGAILMVDLRLLGVAARRYTVTNMVRELTPWSWAAFALSLVTGIGLFITRASHYASNVAFQAKAALLVLAAINLLAFHYGVYRRVALWDDTQSGPLAARVAGAASLLVWSGTVLAGRWVGHLS